MSLIRVRRTATLDSEAQDIKLPFIITFNNGKKEFREGYSAEEVRRRFDKSVAALYGGIKSVKLEDEDKRNGKDSAAADAKFKKGDKVVSVKTGAQGIVNEVYGEEKYAVLFNGAANPDRVEGFQIRLSNSHATDYDPNPQTRGKDIEVFSAQAIREESACENVLRKVIEDVEALVIKIHGPMSSWEEVIENSKMSPELPQAKKWGGTANRRYDYLLARERAISSILSELKRNHID